MPDAFLQLLKARILGFMREPEAVFWTFGFPILIAVALGIAFRNKGPEKIYVAVQDDGSRRDPHAVTEKDGQMLGLPWTADVLRDALVADSALNVSLVDSSVARQELRTGKVALVVAPPREDSGGPLHFELDPTRPESRIARLEVDHALDVATDRPAMYTSADQHVTEPGSRYIDFLVPGLIGMNIMSASMWGIGWSIVEARSRKLLKRLAATPMPRSYYLGAFLGAHLILVTALLVVVLAFARVAFGVEVFGSYLTLYVVSMFGATSFAGLGILIAARTDKSETLSGLSNAVQLPMFVASGVFFSSAHFPDVVQPLIKALPLTALNDALRAVMTDGHGLLTLGPQLAVLAVWGVVCFAVALRWFRWL